MSGARPDPVGDAPRVVTVRYGDLVIRFDSPDLSTRFRIPREYEEFRIADDADAVARVSWTLGALQPVVGEPAVGGEVWEYHEIGGGGRFTFYRGHDRTPYAQATFGPALDQSIVVQDATALGSDVADLGMYPLTELLATRFLSRVDSVDLHASTAALDGRAYVFMGHSGAGKTTISEIAIGEGATVLSDDRTLVGVRDGIPMAWGTPWHGSGQRSSSRKAPIAGIFLLVQASEERLVPVGQARAFQEVFVRLIHQRLSRAETEAALSTVERLVAVAPVYELHFRPVPDAFHAAVRAGSTQMAPGA